MKALATLFCGIGLACMFEWLVVAIISNELALLTFASGAVLALLGCILERACEYEGQ